MNPTLIPSPDALPLPGPVWLFESLLHLTFVLHLLAMNFLLGGAIVALVERLRSQARGGDSALDGPATLARWIETKLPATMAFTVTLGVAPLLFVQVLYGHLFYSASVITGWAWFSVVPIITVTYYLIYGLSFKGDRFGVGQKWMGALTVVGLLTVAFLYVNNMTLGLRPEVWAAKYFSRPGGTSLNVDDPTFFPRWLHFVLAAMAVTGMVIAVAGGKRIKNGDEAGREWVQKGALWFVVPTLLQFVTGLWWLIRLPRPVMMPLMGDDSGATMVFMISITLPIFSLVMTGIAMRHRRPYGLLHGAAGLLLLTIVGMVLTRQAVRVKLLEPHFDTASLATQPAWGVFALFAVLLVVALVTVVWMIVTYAREKTARA